MSEWVLLREAGVPGLLRAAAHNIDRYGWARGVTRHAGRVDVFGALALAAGVPKDKIGDDMPSTVMHARKPALLSAAWELLEAAVGKDPSEWNDESDARRVIAKLNELANLLDIAA